MRRPALSFLPVLSLPLVLWACPAPEEELPETQGCDGAVLLEADADTAVQGPWPVGARKLFVDGLTTEVLYPAEPGSEEGKATKRYDIRLSLPPDDRDAIPDEDNPWQECDCYAGLPPDAARGPYPVVVFIHGTAGFRTQTLTQMVHWASRGFVVLSADHPGIWLADVLDGYLSPAQEADAQVLLDAVAADHAELDFLDGLLDKGRLAMSGHSAGGMAVSGFGDQVQVLMPMAAGGTDAGAALESVLVLGGMDDGVVAYSSQQSGYTQSPAPKRLVGLEGAGHLAFSDICAIGEDEGGVLRIAQSHGIAIPDMIVTLANDGCGPDYLSPQEGWDILNASTAAVLEETLQCQEGRTDELPSLAQRFPAVGEYLEQLTP